MLRKVFALSLAILMVLYAAPAAVIASDADWAFKVENIKIFKEGSPIDSIDEDGEITVKSVVTNISGGAGSYTPYIVTMLCEGTEEIYKAVDISVADNLSFSPNESLEAEAAFNALAGQFIKVLVLSSRSDMNAVLAKPVTSLTLALPKNKLWRLSINGVAVAGLQPELTEYKVALPSDKVELPLEYVAEKVSDDAVVTTLNNPTELPGRLEIKVSYTGLPDTVYSVFVSEERPDVTLDYYGGNDGVSGITFVYDMDDTTKRFSDFDETFSYGLPRTAEEVAANLPSRLKGALYLQPKGSPGENNTDYRSTDSPGPDWYRLTFARSATVYCLAVGPSASATGNMKFLANDNWKNVYNNNTGSTSTSGGTYYISGGQSLGKGTNYGWVVNNGATTTLRNVYLYEKEIIVPEGETVELVTGVYGTGLANDGGSVMYSLAIQFKEKEKGNVEIKYYGGNTINVVPNMSRDTKRFADNNCSFNNADFLPPELEGATYLQTSYSDSQAAPGGKADIYRSDEAYAANTTWLSFTIDRSATVYYLTPSSYTGNRGQFWLREWTGGQPGDSVENPSTIFLPGPQIVLSGSFARYWKVNNEGNEARNRVYLAKKEYVVPKGEKVLIELPVMGSLGNANVTTNPYVYSVAIQWKEDSDITEASPAYVADAQTGTAVVSGSVTGGVSPYVTIQVAKPGVDIDTAEAEDLVYINSVRADADGSYSFSIPFDEPGEFPYVLTFGGFDGGIYDETYINGAVKGTINYIPYFTFGGGTAAGQTLTVTSYIEDGPAEYKLILALYSDNKLLGVGIEDYDAAASGDTCTASYELPAPLPQNTYAKAFILADFDTIKPLLTDIGIINLN